MNPRHILRTRFLAAVLFVFSLAAPLVASCCHEGFASAQVEVHCDRVFRGSYRTGEPFDVLTVAPDGSGETLEEVGITLRVRIICNVFGDITPITQLPRQEIVLYSTTIGVCTPLYAARATDDDGWTEFTGTFHVGGCADELMLFADGLLVANVPIRLNSPDTWSASPLGVDGADLVALARHLGNPSAYSICFDYNEDGAVDAGDLAYFATALGAFCE